MGYIIRTHASDRMPISEFPNLFTMQLHTGMFGLVFGVIWFGLAVYETWSIAPWMNGGFRLWITAITTFAGFLAVAWLAGLISNKCNESISEINDTENGQQDALLDLETKARYFMLSFSLVNLGLICILIWLTGGAISPFVPFYVMTFTLTINKNKAPHPGLAVLSVYLVAVVLACLCERYFGSLIPRDILRLIQSADTSYLLYGTFICASLVVPFVSAWSLVRKKEKLARKANRNSSP